MKIKIENISKKYDRPVLNDISCEFCSGKMYVIKGVSGCGKTTLLNIIGGLEHEFDGNVSIDGRKVGRTDDTLRCMTGYVYQQSLLISGMTVLENLLLIRNDRELIMKLLRDFGLDSLCDKFPEQISGGERQRASVVRALLSNPELIIADEPTASLDNTNSENVAKMLASCRMQNKIVIVATHEHCFDELADEIIYLRYGKIEKIEKKTDKGEDYMAATTERRSGGSREKEGISAWDYNIKRNRNQMKFSKLLPFVIMYLLIFTVFTIQNSFRSEYMRSVKDRFPVDSFSISEAELENFPYKDRIVVYDYYTAENSDTTALYLADKENSVLSINGMIQYGKFPEKQNEVLVSHDYVEHISGDAKDPDKYIGTAIKFKGNEYIISGILYDEDARTVISGKNENFSDYLNSDIYYQHTEGNLIYIPYGTMQKQYEPSERIYGGVRMFMAYYPGLFNDMKTVQNVRNAFYGGDINIFDRDISEAQGVLDNVTMIFAVVFAVCFLIACIFMSSQIQIELFYRKKELGYLQIFGLNKKRIMNIIYTGYMIGILTALVPAMAVYAVVIVAYKIVKGHFIICNPLYIIVVMAVIIGFYSMSVLITANKFLKKDIISLVS